MAARDRIVQIPVEGGYIAGTLMTPGTLIPGVLFVHGWGGSQQQYLARARETAALGCVCLTFNLRGHAETMAKRETVSRETNLGDVLAAYDVLAKQPDVDRAAIAVVGSSYGGYLGALLTTLRPVRWLALRAPALYHDSGWDTPKLQLAKAQSLVQYRRSVIKPEENRALRACAAFRGDVLVIESELDDIVPHPVIKSYTEACTQAHSLTYRVIKGADHGLADESAQRSYTALLTNWLSEMLTGARQGIRPVAVAAGGGIPEAPPTEG
ncbi:MAG TPA: alpha/beta fold hydrolase [Burkholderiaceae bacterium]|nr:alpha/beta fold hydrolase [Burkholderiaceae bacterium]